MLRIGHNKLVRIEQKGNIVTFHNLRDFDRKVEDYNQKENRITQEYDVSKIKSAYLYVCPFGFFNLVAHTFLCFHFDDGKSLCVTVEIQAQQGESYNYFKAFFDGYRAIVIWGTESDVVGLRVKVRKENVYKYPIHMDIKNIRELFEGVVKNTNKINKQNTPYLVVRNNCTSAIWNIARKFFNIPARHPSLFFSAFLPNYLAKLGVVKLKEERKV